MKYYIILSFFFLGTFLSYSQITPEDKVGAWYSYGGSHQISEKTSITTYAQVWLYEPVENFNFVMTNVGLNYKINPKLNAAIAFGYTDFDANINESDSHTYEDRLHEQLSYKHKVFNLTLNHRFRIEHRFLERENVKNTRHRLRYRIGSKIKLNKTLFINIDNELLAHAKDLSTVENRFYTALGINVLKNSNIQIGYMNRNFNHINQNLIQLGIYIKTNHMKQD